MSAMSTMPLREMMAMVVHKFRCDVSPVAGVLRLFVLDLFEEEALLVLDAVLFVDAALVVDFFVLVMVQLLPELDSVLV